MRLCLVCDEPLINKRSDAVYCSEKCGNLKRGKRWKEANPDKVITNRIRENSHAETRIFSRIKSRAKRLKIPFNLEISDIQIPHMCPVLGIEIKPNNLGFGTNRLDSASVDRIIPNKGYTKGNVRIISQRANLLKSNAEIWELEAVLNDLKSRG